MKCDICGDSFLSGGMVELRDMWGTLVRVLACMYCATWLRNRQRSLPPETIPHNEQRPVGRG